MNEKEKKKAENELKCLKKAIELGKDKKNKTGEILRLLDEGEYVERVIQEKPDIIFKCSKGKEKKQLFLGIEMFEVDENSSKKVKNGKITFRSTSREDSSKLDKIYRSGHQKAVEGLSPSEEDLKEIVKETALCAGRMITSKYQTLCDSLQYGIDAHNKSISEYIENLSLVAGTAEKEIIYFINIKSSTNNLFTYKQNTFKDISKSALPITEDMLSIIESIPSKQVKYIVLLLENIVSGRSSDVIAFQNGNIKKHLQKQGIIPYRFLANEPITHFSVSDIVDSKNGIIKLPYKYSFKEDGLTPLGTAHFASKRGKPIIISRQTASLLFTFQKKTDFYEKYNGDTIVQSKLEKSEILRRYDYFTEKKFPLSKGEQ